MIITAIRLESVSRTKYGD